MLRVSINGQPCEFIEPMTILHALQQLHIEIPALCDDPRLKPIGACRACVVQIEGHSQPVTACNTQLVDGMQIQTHSAEIEELRKTLLRLLAERYPDDAVLAFPEKPFHRALQQYEVKAADGHVNREIDASHPYIQVDMSRCIYCYRCVRICDDLQGQFVWRIWNRGDRTKIVPDSQSNLLESSCVACGACVDSCPSGALEDKTRITLGTPTTFTRTTCPYCGVGCEMNVGARGGKITEIKPVLDAPVNKGHLCSKGRYAFGFVDAADRVRQPMIRENGQWRSVSWEQAMKFCAVRLREIIEKHGPDSVAVLGSARATNEDNYLTQKFARLVIGTNNVDCCARVCHAPTAEGMRLTLGTGAATSSYDDIERARTILLCGSNATENHPIIGARIKQAGLRGANLIVIDPRKIELAHYAKFHLQLRPGTNIPLLNAMACVILEEHLYDGQAVRDRVSGFEEFSQFIRNYSPEHVARICGVDEKLIRSAARQYASQKPSIIFHGLGMTEHVQGTEGVMSLVNLALLTGNFGKPGTGMNPLRGQNNVQGSAHMGCDPHRLTGYAPIESARAVFEKVWRAQLPKTEGLNLLQMVDAAKQGKLKALYAIGYDIALTNPNAKETREALDKVDLLIVQDMFLNELAKQSADVFLPACSSFEKDGTFMNAERRIQRVRKVFDPIGDSRPDWQILCDLSRAMNKGEFFNFNNPEEIWNEIREVWPGAAGITYQRLDRQGLQWPCPDESHPGTSLLHVDSFPIGPRAPLSRIDFHTSSESTTDQFPFLLITGRSLYQFNAGTMTMRTPSIELRGIDLLDISSEDAERLRLCSGDRVTLRSRYGQCTIPVQINPAVQRGQLFATFQSSEIFLNNITGPHRDNHVDTPEYKITAVQVLKP